MEILAIRNEEWDLAAMLRSDVGPGVQDLGRAASKDVLQASHPASNFDFMD